MRQQETIEFLQQYQREQKKDESWLQERVKAATQPTFRLTTEELTYGARVAWRNSNKCIGRLFWQSLHVIDARHMLISQTIFDALFDHITYATNDGKIRPTITIFETERVRIHNHQLIRYAGYETADGVIGDPHSIRFTNYCEQLGWQRKGTPFDLLPLVVEVDGEVSWREIPQSLIKEVTIMHPDYPQIAALGLKWYAVPMIADMKCTIAGIDYGAAPFNGWYMGTEIGARNLADETRYNQLPQVAQAIGILPERNVSLWKDRALVELNYAVLYSFKKEGVSIVDHHTAAQQFTLFQQQEQAANREVTGNWTWLIPPLSPATTAIFHTPIANTVKKPNYFYQTEQY